MESPIRAEGLVRRFGGVPVLDGVDLTVAGGDVVALLGANGAGKTTLLRVLAGLLRPSAGRLLLFGIDLTQAPPALRRRIGYVGHESSCYPDLTALENLSFYAELFDIEDAARRTQDLITWAGLEGAARRPVREYSRGMSQRLALARAFLHEPDLLLLDEPFTGLDRHAVTALQERLTTLARAGHSIVFTTHEVERAAPIATRAAILHRGRMAWTKDDRQIDPFVLAQAYEAMQKGHA